MIYLKSLLLASLVGFSYYFGSPADKFFLLYDALFASEIGSSARELTGSHRDLHHVPVYPSIGIWNEFPYSFCAPIDTESSNGK